MKNILGLIISVAMLSSSAMAISTPWKSNSWTCQLSQRQNNKENEYMSLVVLGMEGNQWASISFFNKLEDTDGGLPIAQYDLADNTTGLIDNQISFEVYDAGASNDYSQVEQYTKVDIQVDSQNQILQMKLTSNELESLYTNCRVQQ